MTTARLRGDRELKARRRSRAAVLQALYEVDSARRSPETALSRRLDELEVGSSGRRMAEAITLGVLDNLKRLDETIAHYAPTWPVSQMAVIDRNILRMAIYEILLGDATPPKVAINEAVELAKAFGSDSSPKLVNGVLGTLMRDVQAGFLAAGRDT